MKIRVKGMFSCTRRKLRNSCLDFVQQKKKNTMTGSFRFVGLASFRVGQFIVCFLEFEFISRVWQTDISNNRWNNQRRHNVGHIIEDCTNQNRPQGNRRHVFFMSHFSLNVSLFCLPSTLPSISLCFTVSPSPSILSYPLFHLLPPHTLALHESY